MLKSRKHSYWSKTGLAATVLAAVLSTGCGGTTSASSEIVEGQEQSGEDGGWSLFSFAEEKKPVVIPAGTAVRIRTAGTLSSKTNQAGESFVASLEDALVIDGKTIAPAGSRAVGTVSFVERSGRVKGVARMGVKLTEIHASDGTVIPVATDSYVVVAKKTYGKDAQKVGIGAGVGAAIGAIAGGGGGALKGAGAGAGAGGGAVLATRGDPAVIASESVLTFTLEQQISVEL